MTKPEFIIKAKEMFDGQFPNEIKMDVPRFDWMGTTEKSIKEELWDWFRVSIEKYDELVSELDS
jgi:hypothetical protein